MGEKTASLGEATHPHHLELGDVKNFWIIRTFTKPFLGSHVNLLAGEFL